MFIVLVQKESYVMCIKRNNNYPQNIRNKIMIYWHKNTFFGGLSVKITVMTTISFCESMENLVLIHID